MFRRKKKIAEAGTSRFARETMACIEERMTAPIPRLFQRTFGGYFRECLMCRRPLRSDCIDHDAFEDDGVVFVPYLIVKTVRHGEPWVEYAICVECLDKLNSTLSRDSNARIESYLDYGVRVRDRFERLVRDDAPISQWVDRCVLTGESRARTAEYQMLAMCMDTRVMLCSMPYAVCGRGFRILEESRSAQSMKKVSRFVKQRLGVEAAIYDKYPR